MLWYGVKHPIPPPTHTHTHANKQCALLCQAQQASCDGAPLLRATCPTQTIGPTEGYCRAYGGGYCSSCRDCKRLLFVTVIKAFNVLKMHFGTSLGLLLWCCDTDSMSLRVTHAVFFSPFWSLIRSIVPCDMQLSKSLHLCILDVAPMHVLLMRAWVKTLIVSPTGNYSSFKACCLTSLRLNERLLTATWHAGGNFTEHPPPIKPQRYCICFKWQLSQPRETHYITLAMTTELEHG